MTSYKQGDVLLAKVYFRDTDEYKQRPVVIVGNEMVIDIDLLIAPVTSQQGRNPFDIEIQHWQDAGLVKPSIARVSKLHAIPQSSIVRKLGQLHPSDLQAVLKACKELF